MATYSFNFPKTRIVGGLDAVRSALTENNMALETWLNTRVTATADLVLATIGDMVLDAPVDGELLRFNGTNWVNNTLAEAGVSAVGHTHLEADITDLQSYLLNITGESIGDLSDVTVTAVTTDEILGWNGSAWVNRTLVEASISGALHTHTLDDDLSDVVILTPAAGHILEYTGAVWANNTPAGAGILTTAVAGTTYMPLAGGTFTGDVTFANNVALEFNEATGTDVAKIVLNASDQLEIYGLSGGVATKRMMVGTTDMYFYEDDGTTISLRWDDSQGRWEFADVPVATASEVKLARIPTQIYARRATSSQTNIASGTAFAWNQVDQEDWEGWASSPNPERITVDEAGFYQIDLNYGLNSLVAAKSYRVRVQLNGTTDIGDHLWTANAGDYSNSMSVIIELAANDYLTAYITHNESPDTVDLLPGLKSGMRVTKLF